MSATSHRIEDDVRSAIAEDPRVPYPTEIAVEAYGGAVSLRGTVGSFAEKSRRPPTRAEPGAWTPSTTSCAFA